MQCFVVSLMLDGPSGFPKEKLKESKGKLLSNVSIYSER